MTTHTVTVIEKKGKDLKVGDEVWYAQEWKKLSKTDRNGYSVLQGMLAFEYPNDLFLVRIPSSPIPTETVNNRLVEALEYVKDKTKGTRDDFASWMGTIERKCESALSSVPSSPNNK